MVNESPIKKETIVFGEDSIVIQTYLSGVTGGRTLDLSDWEENVVKAGHVIVQDNEGVCKPLKITDGKYIALPANNTYLGVLFRSILKTHPEASIMTAGTVNKALLPAPLPEGFLPTILQSEDIEA